MIKKVLFLFLLNFITISNVFGEETLDIDENLNKVNFVSNNNISKQNIKGFESLKFNDLFSGAGIYNLNIDLPKGVNGDNIDLNFNYNSYSSDSFTPYGYGWDINLQPITRSSKNGIDNLYKLNNFFAQGNDLVSFDDKIYYQKNYGKLKKYIFENNYWKVIDELGNTYYYGNNDLSILNNPKDFNQIYSWYLTKKIDINGNEVSYSYFKDNNLVYLDGINYVNIEGKSLYNVKFNYIDKNTSITSYRTQFEVKTTKLLSGINLYLNEKLEYEYKFSYDSISKPFSHLTSFEFYSKGLLNKKINFTYGNGKDSHLLTKIEISNGLEFNFSYTPAVFYKENGISLNKNLPFNVKTLSSIEYLDKINQTTFKENFTYSGGLYYYDKNNILDRQYAGFSEVIKKDNYGKIEKYYFHQGKGSFEGSKLGEFEDDISKKGNIYREEIYDESGNTYTTKITKWVKQDKGNNIYFVLPERVTNILWNKDLAHIDNSETFEYDQFGNILKNIKFGEVNANTQNGDFTDIKNDKIVYEYNYASDENNIQVNNICEEKIKDYEGNQISFNKYFYDNLGQCLVSKGLLTKKSFYYNEEDRYLSQSFTYDNGVLKTESDFLGNITSYEYDENNLLPISKTNPKGWTETYLYNYKIQKPISIVDVNGVNYKLYYDDFGNLIKKSVINPNTNSEIILEENIVKTDILPNYIQNKKYIDSDNYITTRVYFDGFGREIEKKVSSKYNNQFSTTKIRYNKYGNKEFVTYPKFENNIEFSHIGNDEKGNILTYDTLGRILTQINKTGTTKFEYDLLKTTQINQKLVKKDLINDIFGNLLKVKEYNQNEIYETNYSYNNLNKLSKIVDAKGNIRNYNYDSLARLIKQEDLHKSSETDFKSEQYSYNDNSQILSKKVLSGDIINYTYDNLGRVINENIGNEVNQFVYDIGDYSKGQLTKTIKNNYSEEYKYNFLGQKIEDKKLYSDNNYTLKYENNIDGSIKTITYPDNKETSYIYENGFINKLKYDNNELISSIDYAENNIQNKKIFTNGLIDEKILDYEYGYRLIGKKSYLGENYYQNLAYTFDEVGNISKITDSSNIGINKVVNYSYDDLNRLLNSNIIDGNNTQTNLNYTYDSIGNITNNSLFGEYNYINGSNPQSLTQIGTGITLSYDSNGNVNNESINGINKSYTYNSKGELLSGYVNGNTINYLYDSNSNRVQKESINLENIKQNRYLNNDFEIENQKTLDGSGNILTQTKTNKYIFLGNEKIFTIEEIENSENIVYNISDHLGGGSVDINNTGTILQKSDYYPYGGSRVLERSDSYKNNYLFTGKELDSETGLQYFEVRYYNPDFGRFYGQDRVFWELGNTKRGLQVLQDPQQLNSYSYARNNPIIYVDPSGEIVDTFWDAGNVSYDIGGILGGSALYVQGVIQNNQEYKNFGLEGIKNSSIDAGSDSLATLIPGVPAGGTKIAKFTAKNGNEIVGGAKEVIKYTNKQYTKMAKDLGFKEVKKEYSNGQKIFYNNKTKKFISGDVDQHNGGIWKMADSIKGLGNKKTRLGTYDKDLKKIGD